MNKVEHLLVCLIEECAEVQKEAAKALRFGLRDKWKDNKETAEKLSYEIIDMLAIVEMLTDENALPLFLKPKEMMETKKERVLKFMTYAVKRGTLTLET